MGLIKSNNYFHYFVLYIGDSGLKAFTSPVKTKDKTIMYSRLINVIGRSDELSNQFKLVRYLNVEGAQELNLLISRADDAPNDAGVP